MPNETVLVVEDEVLVGMELKEDLERLGYVVPDVVSDGDRVVEAIAMHRPDLVLMDIRLDGSVDGIDAAYQAKAEFEVPVIYLTAYSDAETLRRAATTEPAAFLLKPFDERELSANVEIALARAARDEGSLRDLRRAAPVVEALETAALLADPDGRVMFANQAAARALRAVDPRKLRGMELSRLAPPGADEGACREVRSLGGDFLPLHAWARRLERRDGLFLGSYVSIDSMDAKERLLLERSAREMNDVMARILPHPDAAGAGFRVGGFLNPRPSGSGDSFDVFRADRRSVGFYGLDVMGHGMMSALIAFSLHTLIPTIGAGCRGLAPSPEEVIRVLNEKFKNIGDRSASPFFTIAYGLIDTVTGQFSIARAGHIPVLHQSTAGAASYLETPGAAVGVFDELAVAAGCGVLEPGDRLFLASDGLLEAFAEDDLRAAKRKFSDFVISNRSLGLDELSARIYEFTARGRTGNTFIDDSSLLAIERTARKSSKA